MHIAVLGLGFGAYHGKLYKEMDRVKEVTFWGRNEEKLKEIQKDINCRITNDINDILTNEDIDLVDICLPGKLHKEYAIMAMEHGKNVLLETPGVLNQKDGIEILEAAKKYNRNVFVNMFLRCETPYEYLYETLSIGNLGSLKHLNVYRKTPPLWGSLGLSSIFTNFMIHDFDFVTWLLSKPKSIVNQNISDSEDSKAVIDLFLDYGKTKVHVSGNSMVPFGYPFAVGYEAVFEKGTVKYYEDGYEKETEKGLFLFSDGKKESVEYSETEHCRRSLEQVLIDLDKGEESKMALSKALISLNIAFNLEKRSEIV